MLTHPLGADRERERGEITASPLRVKFAAKVSTPILGAFCGAHDLEAEGRGRFLATRIGGVNGLQACRATQEGRRGAIDYSNIS